MTARDDALLAPDAVRRVQRRARHRGLVVGGCAAVLLVAAAALTGPSSQLIGRGGGLALLVVGIVMGVTTLRTSAAANGRALGATGHRKATGRRWNRAIRHDRVDELSADEATEVVRWADASLVSLRLTTPGLVLGGAGLTALSGTTLVTTTVTELGGGLGVRTLVALVLAAAVVALALVLRRETARLRTFLAGLEEH